MANYTDTSLPNLKVGTRCYALAECARHFQRNYEHLRAELEKNLNLIPQWKKDMLAAGTFVQMHKYEAETEPVAWEVNRLQTMPTGYQTISLKRSSVSLQVQNNSFPEAYCMDVQKYLDGRMESTRDKMLSTAKGEEDRKESENRAQREIDLEKARALLNRDAELPSYQRNAMHKGAQYAASIESASKLINSQTAKPKKKAAASAMVQANKRSYAQGCVKHAEQTVESRKRILATRERQGKAGKIAEAKRELADAQEKVISAKQNLFQC